LRCAFFQSTTMPLPLSVLRINGNRDSGGQTLRSGGTGLLSTSTKGIVERISVDLRTLASVGARFAGAAKSVNMPA
jgi:hypothetical protein